MNQGIIDQAWLDAHPGARTVSKASSHKGYAAEPGTGPKGETCGTCKHHVVKRMANRYHKCALVAHLWTGGGATDIKVRSAACRHWEPGQAQNFTPQR
jgi:ribosomal protein L37AE/L43A